MIMTTGAIRMSSPRHSEIGKQRGERNRSDVAGIVDLLSDIRVRAVLYSTSMSYVHIYDPRFVVTQGAIYRNQKICKARKSAHRGNQNYLLFLSLLDWRSAD
jgi:hypothetical protein